MMLTKSKTAGLYFFYSNLSDRQGNTSVGTLLHNVDDITKAINNLNDLVNVINNEKN
jgi:hypothetical protein